eukprot:Mrub_01818.p1 GENE.Mrub_01818~~Mrub_01818.p1  ORF type:complete len:619 (+),score=148.87 Mrub_01818:149-1858(+)
MDEVGDLLEFDLNPLQTILKNLYSKVSGLERNFDDYRKTSEERLKDAENQGDGLSWLLKEFKALQSQNPMEYIRKVERSLNENTKEIRNDTDGKFCNTYDRLDELKDLLNSKIDVLNNKIIKNSSNSDKLGETLANVDEKLKNVDAVLNRFQTFEGKFNDLEHLVNSMQNTFAKAEKMQELQNVLTDLQKLFADNQSKYDKKFESIEKDMDARFKYQSSVISKLEAQIKQLKDSKVDLEEYETTVSRIVNIEKDLNQIKQDDSIKNMINDLSKKFADQSKSQSNINERFSKDFQNSHEWQRKTDLSLTSLNKSNQEFKDKFDKLNLNIRYISDNKLDKFDFEKIEEKVFKMEGEMHKVSNDLKKYDFTKDITKLKEQIALNQNNSENTHNENRNHLNNIQQQFKLFTKIKMFDDFSEYVRGEFDTMNTTMTNNQANFVSIDEINKLKRMIKNIKLPANEGMSEGDVLMSKKPFCASCNQPVNMKTLGPDYYAWNEMHPNIYSGVTSGMSNYGTGYSTKLILLKNEEADFKFRTTHSFIKNKRQNNSTSQINNTPINNSQLPRIESVNNN